MPIKLENRARYVSNWCDISSYIRFARARGRCECTGECGKSHWVTLERAELAFGTRFRKRTWRCLEKHGEPALNANGTVVLTVAHLDHTPENNTHDNLVAMCQACHLRYDADHHRKTRAETRRQQHRDAGQAEMFNHEEER